MLVQTNRATSTRLTAVRNELQRLEPPIVIFNKSHSGSRLLARLVAEGGVFMGAHLNESNDSWDVLKLVEYLVERYYPDYSSLWDPQHLDEKLVDLIRDAFGAHTEGLERNMPWGWKLCETAYILPVLDFLFPQARYIHLIRDGRDVAFTDHRAPNRPFWKKIYFNTDGMLTWRGLKFNRPDYEQRSHIYNALHWANSVSVGRGYGSMLRDRYLEIRYEDLCESFEPTASLILRFINVEDISQPIEKVLPSIYQNSVGKYRSHQKQKVDEVIELLKPLLLSLGYIKPDGLMEVARARVRGNRNFS